MKTYLYLTSVGCLGGPNNVVCQIQGYNCFVKNAPQCKNYMGGGGVHGGNSMIRLNPLCSPSYPLNPYQGTYISDAKTISTFSVSI